MRLNYPTPKSFTLIELLIVVAIIAILAAIAVPNFLEAQVRAKVSRTKADMRTIATGAELYFVDNNSYMTGFDQVINGEPGRHSLYLLSTPIAYVSNGDFQDPFNTEQDPGPQFSTIQWDPATPDGRFFSDFNISLSYVSADEKATWWALISIGPDGDSEFSSTYIPTDPGLQTKVREADTNHPEFLTLIYDATNGTISNGNIWRSGGSQMNFAGRFIQTVQ